jgi:hypothetical protein
MSVLPTVKIQTGEKRKKKTPQRTKQEKSIVNVHSIAQHILALEFQILHLVFIGQHQQVDQILVFLLWILLVFFFFFFDFSTCGCLLWLKSCLCK